MVMQSGRKGGTGGGCCKGFSLHYGAKKGLSKKSRVEPGSHMHHASCITQPSGKHRKKKTHIMSCYIRHACHTSHSRKTPKVQNSSSKFTITCCRMGP